jgi:hypothetical protein
MNKEEEDQTRRDIMDSIQESVLRPEAETGNMNQAEVEVQAEVVVQVQITFEDLLTEKIVVIQEKEIDRRPEATGVKDHRILPA